MASGFSEALAVQLIFRPTARPVDKLALAPALVLEGSELSFGRARSSEPDVEPEGDVNPERESEPEDKTGEATRRRAPFTPVPKRNEPNPGALTPSSRGKTGRRRGEGGTGAGSGAREGADLPRNSRRNTPRG